ncbi:HK97 gp10 family phage protein [Geobacillus stearothermophilus]|uniref:HK97 gp10 family phage protein n=1 Tax=Geobacillus stearothermophilus TaxID=1422 RepID=UPI003D1C0A96
MFQLKINNFKKYEEQFIFLKENLPKELENYLLDVAKGLLRLAKVRTPKDEGRLRSGWEIGELKREGDDLIITVYNKEFYARFVEYGHKVVINKKTVGHAPGFYMLTVSIKRIKRQIPRRLKKHFDKVLNSL